MIVNGQKYDKCPRSLTFNLHIESYMASMYFECRENNRLPFGQSMLENTAYCKELFDFLDSIVNQYRAKEEEKQKALIDKEVGKSKGGNK